MKKNKEEYKKNFLEMLKSVSKEDLASFIREKGKEPKLIKPFILLNRQ